MAKFKKGDKVTVREGATSATGHTRDPKEVRTVVDADMWDNGEVQLNSNGKGGNIFRGADLIAVPVELDPSKVKAGDTVTVTSTTTAGAPYEISGVVWEPSHSPGVLWLGPVSLNATSLTLTAHQPAPEPEPEWKPGTLADIVRLDDDAVLRAVRVATGCGLSGHAWQTIPGAAWHEDSEVESVRPLVVIDPAAVDVDALDEAALRAYHLDPSVMTADGVRAAVRAALAKLGIEAS